MIDNEKNIISVCEEDKKFISDFMKLSKEMRFLVKGILIAASLQEKQTTSTISQ
uniref:hypothetical protein n=1 Tax=Agathobacter sp. TaxID=2021311 RepID=UPI00405794A2